MRFWYYLIFVIGLCVLVFAVALLVIAQSMSAPLFSAADQTVDFGAEACFDCHPAAHRYCDPALSLLRIQDAGAGSVAAAAHLNLDSAQVMADSPAYLLEQPSAGVVSRYIVQTGEGYAVVAGGLSDQTWWEAWQDDWLASCGLCHAAGYNLEQPVWNELNNFCRTCHAPGNFRAGFIRAR